MRAVFSLIGYVLGGALVLWLVTFTVHNHELLGLNLWPLPYEISLPASIVLLLGLAFGYVLGYVHRWCRYCPDKKRGA
jgi:uncharacterized integral membrane protein